VTASSWDEAFGTVYSFTAFKYHNTHAFLLDKNPMGIFSWLFNFTQLSLKGIGLSVRYFPFTETSPLYLNSWGDYARNMT
jgi:hypothetical protein